MAVHHVDKNIFPFVHCLSLYQLALVPFLIHYPGTQQIHSRYLKLTAGHKK